jgi:hypothetical protein
MYTPCLSVGSHPVLARAEDPESGQNELLEAHGERLDGGAEGASVKSDSVLVPLDPINRPSNA